MRPARCRVAGRFTMASRSEEATVTIDRNAGILRVRPLHKRRVYELPLAAIAEFVVQRVIKTEVAARLAGRKKRKRGKAR